MMAPTTGVLSAVYTENISGANQFFPVNHTNFNMGHWINIQGTTHGEWEEGFAKVWLEAGD